MSASESNPRRQRLDAATSRRLAKLRTIPVDASALLKSVEAHVPRDAQRRRLTLAWPRPMRALAASLLLLGLIMVLVLNSSSGPVLASADTLAQIHNEVLAGVTRHMPVDSIDAANAALTSEWRGAPKVPQLSKDHVMSCCVHAIGRKKAACVAFETDGVRVTMAVADAADVRMPASETVTLNGIEYRIQSHNGINMVMFERDGRWVCMMGKLPVDRLAGLANSLRFQNS